MGHAYLWQDSDGLTLIDTGVPGSGRFIADAIRELGCHPTDLRRMVLTHFHVDHAGGAAEMAGWGDVTVYAHHGDAPFIRGEATGPPPELLDWERPIFEWLSTRVPAESPATLGVDRELRDDDTLDFAGGAQAIAAPGHTPGSIAVFLPGPGVLFTGDAVARLPDGRVSLGFFNADPAQAAASFTRLADLDAEIVCFGHGEPLTRFAADEMRAAVQRHHDNPASSPF